MRFRSGVLLLAVLSLACVHRNPNEEAVPRAAPLTVHVKNENFLDMNVAVVVSGVTHRLGTVSGNGSSDFHISWNLVQSETFNMIASPIGANGTYVSVPLNVAQGQVIEMRIGSQLRQSSVAVREP